MDIAIQAGISSTWVVDTKMYQIEDLLGIYSDTLSQNKCKVEN